MDIDRTIVPKTQKVADIVESTSREGLSIEPKVEKKLKSESIIEEERIGKMDIEKMKNSVKVPFLKRLNQSPNESRNTEILEVFRQVKINIPLLDAVMQIPSYAKFLKDLYTTK